MKKHDIIVLAEEEYKSNGCVTYKNLKSKGVSKKDVLNHFSDIKALTNKVADKNKNEIPELFIKKDINLKAKGFVITTAQNCADVHKPGLRTLRSYAKRHGYELIVLTCRYHNITAVSRRDRPNWDLSLKNMLVNDDIIINDKFMISGSVNISPTVQYPISPRLHTLTQGRSSIFPSVQKQLESLPTYQGKQPKILATTGSITFPNTSHSACGDSSRFDHVFGAIVVTLNKEGDPFIRNITINEDGSFFTLSKSGVVKYSRERVYPSNLKVLRPGDIHLPFVHAEANKAMLSGEKSIVNIFKPEYIVLDDVIDFYGRNHHHENDAFMKLAVYKAGFGCVRKEIDEAVDYIKSIENKCKKIVVTDANHNSALDKWVSRYSLDSDPLNFEVHHELIGMKYKSIRLKPSGEPEFDSCFKLYLESKGCKIDYTSSTKGYFIGDVDHGNHGDKGPNGSHGSIRGFAKLSWKSVTNHGHSFAICKGHYRNGHFTNEDRGYLTGASSWGLSCVTQYEDDHRDIMIIINGEYGVDPVVKFK